MTKKDIVALAEVLRSHNRTADGRTEFTPDHLRVLADFLASQYPTFNQKWWIDYIAGECGQSDEWIFAEPDSTGTIVEDKLAARVNLDEDIPKRGRRSRHKRISEAPREEP
jgi:hypothetical protein